ncbi:hopanoid biosynthesis-associated protein HpnK [Caulobacter sp. S45]|uniref:hopanoid biosynthesis-associated protein HpnK n=1 Tax=Caulobacter sp. S45 TaxID=1641861 RepID=UPI0015757A7E|nr:hopanoid biosynthesis-associated protein HpnK [Caulobacter sp. S45]
MKRLVVTADDFGVAVQVNEAVEQAHAQGVLTAASLMVGGGAVADAAARARRLPHLRTGLHLVLVEGRPVLPAAELPDLVGADGLFRRDMVACAVDIFFKPAARRQLVAEVTAQFEAYAATGLALDHVNTHKHFHLHPTIAGAILKVGRRFGLDAMRVPSEPRGVLVAVEPGARVAPAYVTAPWSELVRLRLRRAGVRTADHVFGLHWSGGVTPARLHGLIDNLPDGLNEIYLHPATADGFEGAAVGYRYAEEFAALTDPRVRQAVAASGAVLGGFADFRTSPPRHVSGVAAAWT